MPKERLKSPRARLFVALDLPDRIRDGLVAWQREALTDPALRALRGESLHVTLCFLGHRPERWIDRIAAIVDGLEPRPVEVRLEPAPRPVPPSQPRLYALDAPSEATVALQATLSANLEAAGLYRPEKRPFWSHLTVARVRPERGKRRPRRVSEPPTMALPASLCGPFSAVRVTLYRSHLRPGGAEYSSLASLDLPPTSTDFGARKR